MLGAIIGDIVGSRWEFNPTNDYNFPLFSDKNSFTDDTICTIAVADALLQVGQGTGLRPDWVARKFNHRSALFRVQNQVTIPEKADQFIEPTFILFAHR